MRPVPPAELLNGPERFEPAPALRDWIFDTFIAEDGELANQDHAHLAEAEIGVLWTNVDNSRNMRTVIGQCELMPPMAMGKWQRARAIQQIEDWFGDVPDFLITISAPAAATMDDASFCALIEHELYHAGQKRDQYGAPKFTEDGRPSFAIRGHDVQEFIGVVARYGAVDPEVAAFVAAANRAPLIGGASISSACGTCLRPAA
jgi:hypothetical protein